MALTDDQKRRAAHALEERFVSAYGGTVPYNLTQIYAALQALDDLFASASVQTAITSAIDTATAPLILTGAQKLDLLKFFFSIKGSN